MTACGSCGAEVIWAFTTSGKRMPVDAEPSPDGNVTLIPPLIPGETPTAVVSSDRDPAQVRHMSHFATCPNAAAHRRSR